MNIESTEKSPYNLKILDLQGRVILLKKDVHGNVRVKLKGIPAERVMIRHYRIDEHHSNSYTVWREMGAPQQVTQEQYEELETSGQLELLTSPEWVSVKDGEAVLEVSMPRQAISLLQVNW